MLTSLLQDSRVHLSSSVRNYLIPALDVVAITLAVYLTGGAKSPLISLYLLVFAYTRASKNVKTFAYVCALAAILFSVVVLYEGQLKSASLEVLAQAVLMSLGTFTVVALIQNLQRHAEDNSTLVAEARAIAHVADLLSTSTLPVTECLKQVSTVISDALGSGVNCEIEMQSPEKRFVPESGGHIGVHIPITAGDTILGTLTVRKQSKPFTATQQNFLSSMSRLVGLYLHRSKIWDDFQHQLEKIESTLILNSSTVGHLEPRRRSEAEQQTVAYMADLVTMDRGKWRLKKEICHFADLIHEELRIAEDSAAQRNVRIIIEGLEKDSLPFMADKSRIRLLFSHLIYHAILGSPVGGTIMIRISYDDGFLQVTVLDYGEAGEAGPIQLTNMNMAEIGNRKDDRVKLNLGLAVCRKIVEAHDGRIWGESLGLGRGRVFGFSLPMPAPLAQVIEN